MGYILFENIILKRWKAKNLLVAVSDATDKREASRETFKHKDELKKAGFRWNTEISAWVIDDSKFEDAKHAVNSINSNNMILAMEELLEFIEDSVDDKPSEKDALSNKIKDYMNKLIEDLENPEMQKEYLAYLSFVSKFWNYSASNQWLIFLHKRDATHVAAYKTWQKKFNRQVKKGAKGIPIFVPILFNKKNADDDDIEDALTDTTNDPLKKKSQKAIAFKIGYVFDISDTEPIPGKEEIPISDLQWRGSNTSSEGIDEIYIALLEFIEDYGIKVEENPSESGEDGWTDGKIISINTEASGDRKFKVLVHEFAHYILHFNNSLFNELYEELKDEMKSSGKLISLRVLKENHADGIAYVVCKHYKLDTKYNINYLLNWRANRELMVLNDKIISTGAKFIIKGIEKK